MRVFACAVPSNATTTALLAFALVSSSVPLASGEQEQQDQFVVPGNPAWLGDYGNGDGTPPIGDYLPLTYVVMGPGGAGIPRVLVRPEDDCPKLLEGSSLAEIDIPPTVVRAVGNSVLPNAFPIKVCEVVLKSDEHKRLWNSGSIHFDGMDGADNVAIPSDPNRFVLVGDTGLRVKPNNEGEESLPLCADPTYKLYDITQCAVNLTEADLEFPATGDYQSLSDWPLKTLGGLIAGVEPNVVVYVGDYLYRQGPCAANNTDGEDCVAINGPQQYFNVSDLNGTVANYLPGNWGDNLYGWWADFFYPALEMLKAAPLIAVRGNHENCARAGAGFYLFMSAYPYPESTTAGHYCKKYEEPFAVPFEHEQFLVNDDSEINPRDKGIDHFEFVEGACPGRPNAGEPPIVAVPQNRLTATNPPQDKISVDEQLARYTQQMEVLRKESLNYDTNFYVSHQPIFAIACNDTDIVTLDWTMQESLAPNTLDRVSACIGGHLHWLEALVFKDQALPAQVLVGHGGTKLIDNYVVQDAIPGIVLEVGRDRDYKGVVERGITSSDMFGFAVMERVNDTGDYDVTFWGLDDTTKELVKVDFSMTIPRGPRVKSANEGGSHAAKKVIICRCLAVGVLAILFALSNIL